MATSLLYNNFTSGIIGKALRRQVSSEIYANSAKKMENVVPLTTGGFRIRPGLKKVCTVESDVRRMIPFVLASDDYHLVLVSTSKIKILSFDDNQTVQNDNNIFSSKFSSTYAVDEISYTQDYARLFMTQIDTPPQVIEKSGISYSIGDIKLDKRTAQTSEENGETIYVDYDYDGLFTEPGKYPAICAYITGRLWFASTIENPYRLYASRPNEYNDFQIVEYYNVYDNVKTSEKYLEAVNGTGTSIVYYTNSGVVVATEEQADIKKEITTTVDTAGYKHTTTTTYTKDTSAAGEEIVWEFESTKNDVESYTTPTTKWKTDTTDDCGMELEPGSDRNDRISWIASSTYVFYGTMSNIYIMDRDISPQNNNRTYNIGTYGSDGTIQPVRGNTNIYYASNGRKQLKSLRYSGSGTSFETLSRNVDEYFKCGITRLAWQSIPEPRLYCVMADGSIMVLVDSGNGEPGAWCQWTFNDAKIIDIAVLDTEEGQNVYCLVDRNGTLSVETFDDTIYTDAEEYDINASVVLNRIDGVTITGSYKFSGIYYVDSLGTEFKIGQEGNELTAPKTIDPMLTKVTAWSRPGTDVSVEISNIPGKDFHILCVAASVEVSA